MSQIKRLTWVLLLNLTMITGLIVIGITAHSLGVLAAGGDFIADSLAIMLGLLAVYLRDSQGRKMAPTYIALINVSLLFIVTAGVLVQAVGRLLHQNPEVHGLPVLIISVISTIAMVVGVMILGKSAGNEDLHMRSVLLDTVSDGVAAAAVAVVGAIIFITKGNYWLDSVIAILVSIIILFGAAKLLKDVVISLRSRTIFKDNLD